jgi:hypothetical protein
MKHEIALLKADIQDELAKMEHIMAEFAPLKINLNRSEQEVGNYDKIVIGYLLHGFYNGCENIFRTVARFFENQVDAGAWHKDLLRRMKLDIPGFRPRLLSDKLYAHLDDFRGFRHRFRHSYGFELDWEREKVVAKRLEPTMILLKEDVTAFLGKLDELEPDADGRNMPEAP